VIAGTSKGIGEALTHGRDVCVLPLDLTAPGTHRAVAESCRELEVGLLVYAAGSVIGTLTSPTTPARRRCVRWSSTGPGPRTSHDRNQPPEGKTSNDAAGFA